MDVLEQLKTAGFSHVMVLEGAACGVQEATVILALWCYEAEEMPPRQEAWVHPYYPVSHRAYKAAKAVAAQAREAGLVLEIRDDIRLKPIFARIPGLTQGRNTLSYLEGVGSRFYAKTFTLNQFLPPTVVLEASAHGLHCGECTRCMQACPTGAITKDGFIVERCLRYWMMLGKPTPAELRQAMGNRLIGCDECQRCCPHNPKPRARAGETVELRRLLKETKAVAGELKDVIGANLTLPNRLLAQACLIAGNSHREELLPELLPLTKHPSAVVSDHAAWAVAELEKHTHEEKNSV